MQHTPVTFVLPEYRNYTTASTYTCTAFYFTLSIHVLGKKWKWHKFNLIRFSNLTWTYGLSIGRTIISLIVFLANWRPAISSQVIEALVSIIWNIIMFTMIMICSSFLKYQQGITNEQSSVKHGRSSVFEMNYDLHFIFQWHQSGSPVRTVCGNIE